jgi:hypothetical protein
LNESPSRVIRRQAMIQPLVHSESKPLWPFHSFPFCTKPAWLKELFILALSVVENKGPVWSESSF